MYFDDNNKFFHGIMFHHFHDDLIHTKGQGSIDKDDFNKMINFIGRDNILDADVFLEKIKNNKLKSNEVCLTFDDAIKSQIDVALPVLEEHKIKSFFFVYTSMFEGKPDKLEFFRYFRMNYFNSPDEFYDSFYKVLDKDLKCFFEKNIGVINEKKNKSPHYSIEDIKFRLVRDNFLTKFDYEQIMFLMFREKQFNYEDFTKTYQGDGVRRWCPVMPKLSGHELYNKTHIKGSHAYIITPLGATKMIDWVWNKGAMSPDLAMNRTAVDLQYTLTSFCRINPRFWMENKKRSKNSFCRPKRYRNAI